VRLHLLRDGMVERPVLFVVVDSARDHLEQVCGALTVLLLLEGLLDESNSRDHITRINLISPRVIRPRPNHLILLD